MSQPHEYTHTHTLSLSLSLSHTHTFSLIYSLLHPRTSMYTSMYTLALSHFLSRSLSPPHLCSHARTDLLRENRWGTLSHTLSLSRSRTLPSPLPQPGSEWGALSHAPSLSRSLTLPAPLYTHMPAQTYVYVYLRTCVHMTWQAMACIHKYSNIICAHTCARKHTHTQAHTRAHTHTRHTSTCISNANIST